MKIAYYTFYVGKMFMEQYGEGKKFALSSSLKSLGLARAMMKLGHDVIIYSPAITDCNRVIPAFTEVENFPEGKLTVKYSKIISKRHCSPINEIRTVKTLLKDHKNEGYDIVVCYNITLGATILFSKIQRCKRVLEYEDNIFNKALVGGKLRNSAFKTLLYNKTIKNTDGLMAVCIGLMKLPVRNKVLTPGVINDDVINNISHHVNFLEPNKPVHIILTGGIHYSKGVDLLLKSLKYISHPCLITIYGNCEWNSDLEKVIAEIPSIHQFEFNGYLPHAELVRKLDSDADILINTTRSMGVGPQAAGFPFKMMEYAAVGRPIISSEIGKLNKDFNKYVTYYNDENPKVIAEKIEEVIFNYNEKESMALKLQNYVLSEYTIMGLSQRLSSFLDIL